MASSFPIDAGGIGGVYHAVSKKHLQCYLNEYAWRYNHRDAGEAQVKTLLVRTAGRCRRGGVLQILEEVAPLRDGNFRIFRRLLFGLHSVILHDTSLYFLW